MATVQVSKMDPADPASRAAIISYLQPVETQALFVLGNLLCGFAGSHYYAARHDDQWVGAGAYFDRFAAISLYSADAHATRALTRHIASRHGRVEYVNAMASVGAVACEELTQLGYVPANDPRQVFMEAAMLEPPVPLPEEAVVRRAKPGEEYIIADLMRHLSRPHDPSPPTAEEVARQVLTYRFVAEVDGRVVATATSNGLAIRCFQILGVVTLPDHRRRGYASALCSALMRHMFAQGGRHAVLFTGPANTSAQGCYERLGFRITGEYCMARFHGTNLQTVIRQ